MASIQFSVGRVSIGCLYRHVMPDDQTGRLHIDQESITNQLDKQRQYVLSILILSQPHGRNLLIPTL